MVRTTSDRRVCFQKGFTLLELLIVVAIIAILASLLLPALSSVKARGQMAGCMSNERQMGIALHMYLEESGQRYPFSVLPGSTAGGRPLYWFEVLSPYLANAKWGKGVFLCPAYKWNVATPDQNPVGKGGWG